MTFSDAMPYLRFVLPVSAALVAVGSMVASSYGWQQLKRSILFVLGILVLLSAMDWSHKNWGRTGNVNAWEMFH